MALTLTLKEEFRFDPKLLEKTFVNLCGVEKTVENILYRCAVEEKLNEKAWALKALTLTDLTTLSGDDSNANVERLCLRAARPFTRDMLKELDDMTFERIHTAAVCVYPSRVADCYNAISRMNRNDLEIAAVATGFPSGQFPLLTRLQEISTAIDNGATEIDIVVDRSLVLNAKWKELFEEIKECRKACGKRAHLKTILAIGECGTMENVYKASMVAMMAGSDFIKTSTGKESVNATLPAGLVMIRAIQDFHRFTNKNVGFKPAGGVRTVKDAIAWMTLIKETLGPEWLHPNLFRLGASGLLDDIERVVTQ